MKTRKLLILSIFCIFLLNASGQQQELYGTAPANYSERSITVNGLTEIFSASGQYTLSADGGGSTASSYTVDVDKPAAAATVFKAYLMGASEGFTGFVIPDACISINGNPVSWNGSAPSGISSWNHYADVTAVIASIINPVGVGITSLTITECGSIDGTALLVIFSDPTTTVKTIVIMFGALSTTGDNFSLTLGEPIDPITPGALLDMGLGIGFSAYGPCGGQISIIDVNAQRLTSSANGEDDGALANGALITVGGIGDLNTNPPDPYSSASCDLRYDDEFYSLLPLITNTTTFILVNTFNPSNDDNIFLAYFEISGVAILGEGIILTQLADTNYVGTDHTVNAHVQDENGDPVVGTMVEFTVLSGPNAGETYSVVTNSEGHAFFTYNGAGGLGVDEIQACFINSAGAEECSNILFKTWITGEDVPVSNWALMIGIMLILIFAVIRFRR